MPAATGTLDDAHSEALQHVLAKAQDAGGTIAHDVDHPLEQHFLKGVLDRAGMTQERYPAKFAALTATNGAPAAGEGPIEGAFSDGQSIEYIGKDESGLTCAQAVFTRTNQILSATVTLTVTGQVDGQPAQVLASQTQHMWKEQTTSFMTDMTTAQPYPATGTVTGALTWQVQYADGTIENPATAVVPAPQNTKADPDVTDPCIRDGRQSGDLTAVVIGLARAFNDPGRTQADVDYWFHRNDWENIQLLVPFAGSVQFNQELAPMRADPNDPNPILQFTLAREEGGMKVLMPQDTSPYLSGFTANPDEPGLLRFSLMATANDDGNTINFGASPWVADTRTYFSATMTVDLSDGTQGIASVVSSEKEDPDPFDGVKAVKPLVYVWHCVVAGTQVTCADGPARAIEECDVGTSVVGGPDTPDSLPVLATLAQPASPDESIYTVTCTSGRTLQCTGTHPLYTLTAGPPVPVQVQALNPDGGDNLMTIDGSDTTTGITKAPAPGVMLFNLWLDASAAGGASPTYYVNGLLTGDYTVQVSLLDEQRSPEALRASLPPELLTDYESYLADQAKTATA